MDQNNQRNQEPVHLTSPQVSPKDRLQEGDTQMNCAFNSNELLSESTTSPKTATDESFQCCGLTWVDHLPDPLQSSSPRASVQFESPSATAHFKADSGSRVKENVQGKKVKSNRNIKDLTLDLSKLKIKNFGPARKTTG
ncbi:hypothetical protein O181_001845 [Austropuccinia psidii MF-1]|uniref:Uncharacterized protein n=1 Tax=Austropuccinia psidii MF-1 TaxID=1389203 RepID=A0A9Q3GC94_9BASI|nr:hypothetical protein [Austropuccinia psidii MF-1]